MATKTEIELKQGNDYTIPVKMNGGLNYSTWFAALMIKKSVEDKDADAKYYSKVALNAAGEGTFSITAAQLRAIGPGAFKYDIRTIDGSSSAANSDFGNLTIEQVVNQGTRDAE